MLVSAAATATKIRTRRLDPFRGGLFQPDDLCFRERFLLSHDAGGDALAGDREWDKDRFALGATDPFSAERDVLDREFYFA